MSGRVICPYNPSHIMPADRLQWHLTMVCRDMRTNGHLFAVCPYNRTHHIKKEKLSEHMRKCPDKPKGGVEIEAIAQVIGPPEDAWESSWPEERKNLNEEYIPAPAKKRNPQGEAKNANEVRQEPAASNPYITPSGPNIDYQAANPPPVDDGWVTVEVKKPEKHQNSDWNSPPDTSLAQSQISQAKFVQRQAKKERSNRK